jgi:hypothetical protein
MSGTDGPYVDGAEVRGLIMQMVQDALQQAGMAPVQRIALQDMAQHGQILQGLAPTTGQPGPPQNPAFGQANMFGEGGPPGVANGLLAALSPQGPPRLPQP